MPYIFVNVVNMFLTIHSTRVKTSNFSAFWEISKTIWKRLENISSAIAITIISYHSFQIKIHTFKNKFRKSLVNNL